MTSIYINSLRTVWVICTGFILLEDKLELHKKLTAIRSPFLDHLMVWFTHVGDGLFMCLAFIVFLFIRIKTAIILIVSFLVASGITQLLKHTFFSEYKRPYFYLKNDDSFRVISDFTYHTEHSFPSGHATTCFVLFTILSFHYQKQYLLQIAFIIAAIFFAYTRVYLSQHFLQDIVAGSVIGVIVSLFFWDFLNPKLTKWDKPLKILDKVTN